MSKRRKLWIAAFLSVTALAVGMEIAAAADESDDTRTWTQLLLEYVNSEVLMFAVGGVAVWLVAHFGWRTWRKHKARSSVD